MTQRSTQATATAEIVPFQFYVPIAKVDKELRQVTGVVTQEILDKQGDLVDYDTAKAFFTNDALWPGNMREMHKAEAVGKKVSCEFDDVNKTITLTSRVSKGAPNTWEKVLDGTLSFYSIGGNGERVAEKVEGKAAKRLFLKQLAEVSYVDNGACPTAKFEIVKADGDHLVDAEPEEPVVDPIAKATAALDAAITPPAPAAVVFEAGSVRKLVGALARATDRLAQKATIVTLATEAGADAIAELPFTWQPETVRKGVPECYDIDRALSAISLLEQLLSSEYWEARGYGSEVVAPDPIKIAQVAAIKAAIDAVLRFVISEHEQQFAPDANGNGGLILELADDTVVEMFVKSLDVVQKAGARHSKNDNEMIQKVHDLSGSLGASCAAEKAAKTVTVSKGVLLTFHNPTDEVLPLDDPRIVRTEAPITEPATKAAVGGDIQKIAAELETAKAALTESQATVAKQAETVAALDARLKTVEALPAGGGPVRSAAAVVDKTIGGPGGAPASAETDEVLKAFDTVAAVTPEGPAKLELVTKKLTYMRAHGLGAISPISGQSAT